MKNAFLIPYDYEEQFSELSDEEIGRIIRAMFDYEKNLIKPNFTDRLLKTVWLFVEKNLDRNKNNYDKRCVTSAENGKKGGRPHKISTLDEIQDDFEEPKKPNENLTKPKKPDNDNDNDINNKKESVKKKVFSPPALEEIEEYAKSRNCFSLAKKFYDYFTAGNWVDSKGDKVRNWKQKFITWEGRENKGQVQGEPKHKYQQHDYSGKDLTYLFTDLGKELGNAL